MGTSVACGIEGADSLSGGRVGRAYWRLVAVVAITMKGKIVVVKILWY